MRVDTSKRDGGDLAIFDLARAGAALTVLVAHGRSLLLLDLKDQPNLSAAGRLFYGATSLGHQAVIVFFVVSGALVTRAILRLEAGGAWSARNFFVARLSRLWTVLLPCLVLGGVLDRLGTALGDGLVYAGRYGALRPWAPPEPIRLDLMTLAGNVGFLQTIAVPTFGTNVPLWSLANEAWYYLAAFLLWSAWRKRARPVFAGLWAGGALLLWLVVLTPDMRWLAPTWAIGAALTVFGPGLRSPVGGWRLRLLTTLSLLAAVAGARATAVHHLLAGDYSVAGATTLWLWAWQGWQPRDSAALGLVRRVAQLTYSLYLSHFPLLAFLAAVLLRNQRVPFGLAGLAVLFASCGAALGYAGLIWWSFERHTGAVRAWAARRLAPQEPHIRAAVQPSLEGTVP